MSVLDKLKPFTPGPVRHRVLMARLGTRRTTQSVRMLPDFLVIGAQRSGTSSLYKYLGTHPQIAPSLRKEVEYFTRRYGNGLDWYRAHFPLELRRQWSRRALGRELLAFEATPDYLVHPLAAERAALLLPSARIVVLLRDPVARAFSHHCHMARLGFESLTFEEALLREPERLAPDLDAMHDDPGHDPKRFLRFSYVARGMYARQLEAWMSRFERDRLLIVQSEELYARPAKVYEDILGFLGVARLLPKRFPNYSAAARGAPGRIPPAAKELLAQRFEEPNRELFELLGQDLGWNG